MCVFQTGLWDWTPSQLISIPAKAHGCNVQLMLIESLAAQMWAR